MSACRGPGLTVGISAAALQAHMASMLRLDDGARANRAAGVSLAQRLGLVPTPPPPLSPAQWVEVHLQSRLSEDSQGECSICLRPFKAEFQVLLSCSHTFHQQCLAAFERFSQQRCCPLCRCCAYQKRRIDDAERLWRHACAARIQAAWRGLLARRQYGALRRLLPPAHPALRRRWAAERLRESSATLVGCVERGEGDVEALFAELDAARQACTAVYGQLERRRAAAERPGLGAAGALSTGGSTEAESPPHASGAAASAGAAPPAGGAGLGGRHAAQPPQSQQEQQQQQVDWEAVLARCLQRHEQPECPICLVSLGLYSSHAAVGSRGASMHADNAIRSSEPCSQRRGGGGRLGSSSPSSRASGGHDTTGSSGTAGGGALAVLSCCAYAFHADCLSAFEALAIASDLPAACPCCRAAYQRMNLR